jgi:hypothetical protein
MDLNFNKNEDHNKLLLSQLKQNFAKVKLGGEKISKLHSEKNDCCGNALIIY